MEGALFFDKIQNTEKLIRIIKEYNKFDKLAEAATLAFFNYPY